MSYFIPKLRVFPFSIYTYHIILKAIQIQVVNNFLKSCIGENPLSGSQRHVTIQLDSELSDSIGSKLPLVSIQKVIVYSMLSLYFL